jgi:D-beta-D-heptose 7-phosphate kinase/D-beta-D-heptose 1-phosphate adenosyltransferase
MAMRQATNLLQLISGFTGLRVLVIGEAMLDRYLHGTAGQLCREAPVPVVRFDSCLDMPGGAANTAVNVRKLGAEVTFLSVAGADPAGNRLLEVLAGQGVQTDSVHQTRSRETLTKERILAGSQLVVRLDRGSTTPLERVTEDSLVAALRKSYARADAVIVSDYGYGIMTPRLIGTLTELQARHPRTLMADARQPGAYRQAGITATKPNYGETLQLLGLEARSEARPEQLLPHEGQLLERTGARVVAVTLDEAGALILERGAPPYRTYARPRPSANTTGAGDTFTSAFTLALAAGGSVSAAAELASAAAGVVVGKDGTAGCSAAELRSSLGAGDKVLPGAGELAARASLLQGERVVFTNGCFDILHRGHITYLNRAKALGDVLVVGINSDDSVRRLKGEKRPINPLEDRIQVLAALSCIDYIVPFGEDTPDRLIEALRPQVFVKGGDYTLEMLPEAELVRELGGEIALLPYLEERSTTRMIEKIRSFPPASPGTSHARP